MSVAEKTKPAAPVLVAPEWRDKLAVAEAAVRDAQAKVEQCKSNLARAVGRSLDGPGAPVEPAEAALDAAVKDLYRKQLLVAESKRRLDDAERADAVVAEEAAWRMALKLKARIAADAQALVKDMAVIDGNVRALLERMERLVKESPETRKLRGPMLQDAMERPHLMLWRLIEVALAGASTGASANLDNTKEIHDVSARIMNWLDSCAPEQRERKEAA